MQTDIGRTDYNIRRTEGTAVMGSAGVSTQARQEEAGDRVRGEGET